MPVIILTAVLAAGFIAIGVISRGLRPEERTRRAVEPLAKLISLAPILGLVIFALLFAFVLKGRLMERASHALMVFALWMYATRFYLYILAHFKHREGIYEDKQIAFSAIGGAGGPADAFRQVCKPDILPHGLGLVYYWLCSTYSLLHYRTA